MTASVRLAAFIFPQYAAMMQTDEMDLTSLGERKRAIFCVIPVNDGSMNYLVSMLFTQCFQQLYLRADERYNGRLPIPVRVIQDEWANVAQPDSYPKVLATCRSYNIGINMGVCLEGAVIVLACIVFSAFAASGTAVLGGGSVVTQVWGYLGEVIFNMLVLVGLVKGADRVVREMFGL